MKQERHNAIRELLSTAQITNQDELRRKLRKRGFAVTQATLSRDFHELHVYKGPAGYALANGNGSGVAIDAQDEDAPPDVAAMLDSFGLRVQRAANQVIVRTIKGGAQPTAAALDSEDWLEVVGTIAGDDTVLIICQDHKDAADVESRLRTMLES